MDSELKVKLRIGDVVKATVQEITKHYAVLSLGDVDCYLMASEFSWGRNYNLKRAFTVGEEIQAVVIQIASQGVMLSVKRQTTDPWDIVDSLYHVGQHIKGKIGAVLPYGAFVSIPNGIQGLLHKSKMSLDAKIAPHEIISEGQEIDVIITSIEKEKRKISFSTDSVTN